MAPLLLFGKNNLAPVPFNFDPLAVLANVPWSYPNGTAMGAIFVASGSPDVVVVVVVLVSAFPHGVAVGWRATAFVDRRRRSNANRNLRKRCGRDKSESKCECHCNFLHGRIPRRLSGLQESARMTG